MERVGTDVIMLSDIRYELFGDKAGEIIAFLAAAHSSPMYLRKKLTARLFGNIKHIRLISGAGW